MSSSARFSRSFSTVKDYDGSFWEGDISNESKNAMGNAPTELRRSRSTEDIPESLENVVAIPGTSHNHFLIVALLEHLCSLYVTDRAKSTQLFKVLCNQLTKIGIMSPLAGVDELSTLRSRYRLGFSNLVHAALANINKEELLFPLAVGQTLHERAKLFVQSRPLPGLGLANSMEFHTSRYREEFCEIMKLGKGAYGSVHKVQHKLDGCYYAVKKISFSSMKPDVWLKILREVKYLAGMQHKHIVRYYNAWLEYQAPALLALENGTDKLQGAKHLPALQYQESSGDRKWNDKMGEKEDNSLSVVFEDSQSKSNRKLSSVAGEVNQSEWSESGGEMDFEDPAPRLNHSQLKRPLVMLHIQMEFCHGTLKEWISDRNDSLEPNQDVYAIVSEEANLKLMKQLLKAMDYIHSNDVIHRDIKPRNIFLIPDSNGGTQVKIGDFGLARHLANQEPLTPHPGFKRTTELTDDDQFYTSGVGTTIYAAPEQLDSSSYDTKSDMYSLGLILFELYQPFCTEMERVRSLMDVRKGEIRQDFCKRWSQQVKFIKQLTDIDPLNRPSARDLLESCFVLSKDQIIENLKEQVKYQKKTIINQRKIIQDKDAELERLRLQIAYMQHS